jgi:hypothetical protein
MDGSAGIREAYSAVGHEGEDDILVISSLKKDPRLDDEG